MSKPKAGQVWFVQFKGNTILSKKKITDTTPLTVSLIEPDGNMFAKIHTYKQSDVEFVELIK